MNALSEGVLRPFKTCKAGPLNASPQNQFICDVHPSQSGQKLIGQTVADTFRAALVWGDALQLAQLHRDLCARGPNGGWHAANEPLQEREPPNSRSPSDGEPEKPGRRVRQPDGGDPHGRWKPFDLCHGRRHIRGPGMV